MSRGRIHASRGGNAPLCGATGAKVTQPGDVVDCRRCVAALVYLRNTYPKEYGGADMRITKRQRAEFIARLQEDMQGDDTND